MSLKASEILFTEEVKAFIKILYLMISYGLLRSMR